MTDTDAPPIKAECQSRFIFAPASSVFQMHSFLLVLCFNILCFGVLTANFVVTFSPHALFPLISQSKNSMKITV